MHFIRNIYVSSSRDSYEFWAYSKKEKNISEGNWKENTRINDNSSNLRHFLAITEKHDTVGIDSKHAFLNNMKKDVQYPKHSTEALLS